MTRHGTIVRAARLGLLAAAYFLLAAGNALASEDGSRVNLEFGPAFTAFIGGNAEETGAGFAGSFSYLKGLDDFAAVGFRVAYSQSYYTKILDTPGQELRARMISGGVEGELRDEDWPGVFFVYSTWGAISVKADTYDLVLNPVRYNQTDFYSDLGGGFRFFLIEHVTLGLDANIGATWGKTADLAEWHFRLGAMIGGRY
ncbi:MAG: hypothetical protein KDH09_16380 [Chrysiogenetes bacterium]|nr:hypothetical protein [Chrysiogenetes bacterium]